MANTTFVTGATGGIGSHLVAHLLTQKADHHLILLVRGNDTADASSRIDRIIGTRAPSLLMSRVRPRLTIVRGDITQPGLGLSNGTIKALAPRITHIVHAAATTQFHLPLECARLVNCTGTRNVLEFARGVQQQGNLRHVAHISTAYVCGTRCGAIREDESLPQTSACANTYEQSKCEAETLVASARDELPLSIFRPSIVVGDSCTGWTIAFNGLYTPLRLIQRGLCAAMPAYRGTPVDVVSTDYVSAVLEHILLTSDTPPGKTYHLVAGGDKAPTVAEVIESAVSYFNARNGDTRIPAVRFVPPYAWKTAAASDLADQAMSVYAPYTCLARRFDDRNTRMALQGTGIRPRPYTEYYTRILAYALATRWGGSLRRAA